MTQKFPPTLVQWGSRHYTITHEGVDVLLTTEAGGGLAVFRSHFLPSWSKPQEPP